MKYFAYVGCRTTKERNARGKGIRTYAVEDDVWREVSLTENLVNSSFLCMDQTGEYLYCIHGDFSEISSFRRNRDGSLTLLNTGSTGDINPVHLSVDRTNRWIFVANLQTGTVAVIPRREDGSVGQVKELYPIPGLNEDAISHPHQMMQDPEGKYLIVSCQGRKAGYGQVDVFRIHSEEGTLERVCIAESREIAEPRHFVFHPNLKWGYGVNEKDYSVTFYHFDRETGELKARQILPTLPDTYTGDGWASGIVITGDAGFIVVSNRKHDSITSFFIDPESRMLKYGDCIGTGGGQPRFITMTPEDRILTANDTTDSMTEISLDRENGRFIPTELRIETESPVCVIFGE